jgi:hypothetical protein
LPSPIVIHGSMHNSNYIPHVDEMPLQKINYINKIVAGETKNYSIYLRISIYKDQKCRSIGMSMILTGIERQMNRSKLAN